MQTQSEWAGIYYTNLTRDDVGGLRYLLSTNTVAMENLIPGVAGAGGNSNVVNMALRPGVEKLTFQRLDWSDTYGLRLYEPNLQRWLTQDPIGEAGGISLYGFVANNPLNQADPVGLWGVEADVNPGGVSSLSLKLYLNVPVMQAVQMVRYNYNGTSTGWIAEGEAAFLSLGLYQLQHVHVHHADRHVL